MDALEMAKALLGGGQQKSGSTSGGQTTTAYGTAVGDSADGKVLVDFGGETSSYDDEQAVEVDTTFFVKDGDQVIVSLVGADGTGKAPVVTGVVGRGDETQAQINAVTNYFWHDSAGAHVSTNDHSVLGRNVLLDNDSLDIRNGTSDSEADQTVLASFGQEVTIGSRNPGNVGVYSQVHGYQCTATASYAHAEGYYTQAVGVSSHAEGDYTRASNWAHSEGSITEAAGDYSHAEGLGTRADSNYQHAEGKYNKSDANSKYLHIVGNGTGAANYQRSNAYNLDKDGNAEFQGEVYVGGCTPNGETPYPVVRYNTSASQSEYYDGSAWTAVPGGGGSSTSVLYFTGIACAAQTGDFATLSDPAITADHVLAECVFANSSYITSYVTWATTSGSLTLNGTCATATTANVVLIKKDN